MPTDPSSPVDWRPDGLPGSRLYGDVYFSSEDGLAETRAVFLAGCGLPDAWAHRRHFTVGELGFGTGLNIAALLTLWKQTRPPGARLTLFSVEAHPMTAADARRALSRWPDIKEAASLAPPSRVTTPICARRRANCAGAFTKRDSGSAPAGSAGSLTAASIFDQCMGAEASTGASRSSPKAAPSAFS